MINLINRNINVFILRGENTKKSFLLIERLSISFFDDIQKTKLLKAAYIGLVFKN